MPYVRKKRRITRRLKLQLGALLIAVVVLASVFGVLYSQQRAVIADNAAEAAQFTPAPADPVSAATEARPSAPEVAATLADKTEPLSIAVIGDSTGNAENEWVYLMAEQLSATYNRPIMVHNWDNETHAYTSETAVGQGEGATVDIWNGSASGRDEGYSLEHLDTLAPAGVDLAFINHGHNSNQDRIVAGISSIIDGLPDDAAVSVIAQNPRILTEVERQESIVASIREAWTGTEISVIDVHAAFTESGDVASLVLEDGFHPNDAGEQLWAETVLQHLS